MGRIVYAHMRRSEDIFRQRGLNHYSIGVGMIIGLIGPSCITHFKEGLQIMNEKKVMTYNIKMNLLFAHTLANIRCAEFLFVWV